MKVIVPNRQQEQQAIEILIQALRMERSLELEIVEGSIDDFPDFTLRNRATGEEIWVEVVQAVESEQIRALETHTWRQLKATVSEHEAHGQEAIIEVSSTGVKSTTPSPGWGTSGFGIVGGMRRLSPEEWILKAIKDKASDDRYGPKERARTTLLVDCSYEFFISQENAFEAHDKLAGDTKGFKEIWCVSSTWDNPKALILAP